MKDIQPISIWKNGQNKTASILDAYIINDDLATSCTFYWMLKEADSTPEPTEEQPEPQPIAGEVLSDGNVTMSGDDYENWDGSNDYAFEYNDYAFEYIANQINVTII